MLSKIKFITVGNLKEPYLRDAMEEYAKRLSGFCKVEQVNIRESKLPDDPSDTEINFALNAEAKMILDALPPRAYGVALCVEGKQFSSPELAALLDSAAGEWGEICFIIGSSHGLAESVKSACKLRLSFSKLTFPHQLMRVVLYEAVYRCATIIKGTKYHK
ncbi:MAG: 23S rRNA (pseudouridine(1915)-N(3))-methyltransferase RlmH [Ruminococcaceae bacterium]|nr:23S rRNA (pseudouridine(1915)-N(3))-methyltransferase RlmH [Oscillospiraceae bacterium]